MYITLISNFFSSWKGSDIIRRNWGLWPLHLLGAMALLAAVFGGTQLYRQLTVENPQYLEVAKLVEDFNRAPKKMPRNPQNQPSPRAEEKNISADDVAAVNVIRDHINGFLLRSYNCGGMTREEYVAAIAEALVLHCDSSEKALWVCGMMQTESSFRLSAKPGKSTNSSARGFLQVIWRYHGKMLAKHGISREDLSTDIGKSVQAGVLVFDQYLRREKGDFQKALRRYRSLSASEAEQQAYFKSVNSVFLKLKGDLRKEVKPS